ncbi:YdeI family protein [Chloroflexota bacterium]
MANKVPELDSALYFENASAWRNWLAANHAKKSEVWLIIYKKGSDKTNLTLESAVMEAICFGWIDGKLKSIDDERYILRYSPRKPMSPWSKINKDRAIKLIRDGKMTDAGMAKINQAKSNRLWDAAYTSLIKEEMPDDLQQALQGDKTAQHNFNNFAASYRNNYIGWINSAKTDATRTKRIAEVVRRAAMNRKPGQ